MTVPVGSQGRPRDGWEHLTFITTFLLTSSHIVYTWLEDIRPSCWHVIHKAVLEFPHHGNSEEVSRLSLLLDIRVDTRQSPSCRSYWRNLERKNTYTPTTRIAKVIEKLFQHTSSYFFRYATHVLFQFADMPQQRPTKFNKAKMQVLTLIVKFL